MRKLFKEDRVSWTPKTDLETLNYPTEKCSQSETYSLRSSPSRREDLRSQGQRESKRKRKYPTTPDSTYLVLGSGPNRWTVSAPPTIFVVVGTLPEERNTRRQTGEVNPLSYGVVRPVRSYPCVRYWILQFAVPERRDETLRRWRTTSLI